MIKDGTAMVEDGWIETYSGGRFHLLNPRADEIKIEDIAFALAGIGRYNGHFRRRNRRHIYTVAEHSVHIAEAIAKAVNDPSSPHFVKDRRERLRMELTGLLHDAAEAYIGDMTRPLKVKMLAFKEVEARIDAKIAEVFDTVFPLPPIVKEFDTRILVDERAQGMDPERKNVWATDELQPLGADIMWWTPDVAESKFMDRFIRLTSEMCRN